MESEDDEEKRLRSVALQNAQGIFLARRRAEEALRRQSEWLRITLASIGDAVISTDAEGRVTYLNGVAESLTGWTESEAAGRLLPDVFHIVNENTRLPAENPALRALREGTVVGLANHTLLIARDGTERPIDDSAAPIRDEAGDSVGAVLVFRDVTERKLAEQALRESEGRHRFLADLAEATQAVADPEEVMTLTARMLGRHLGADRCAYAEVEEESVFVITGNYTDGVPSIVGRWLVDAFGPELVRLMAANLPYVMDDVEVDPRAGIDLSAYRATTIRAVICVPLHKGGKFTAAMAVHQTAPRRWTPEEIQLVWTVVGRCWESIERGRVARDLRESEERHRKLADNLPSGFIYQVNRSADDSRRFAYISGGVEALCGLSPGEVMADPASLDGLIAEEDRPRVQAMADAAFLDRRQFDCEFRVQARDGRVRWLHSRAAPRAVSGDDAVWDGIAVDVTERVEMEEALRESDRKKDEFIALLGHELRNPLAPIRNGLQEMRLAGGDADAVAKARDMMDRQLGHMVRLIDDLLDVSRIGRNMMGLRRASVLLADVVGSAVEASRPSIEEAGHTLSVSIPEEPVALDADLTRLAQVFSNLLTNSAKYTERGGQIWLTAERREGVVVVRVRDTGIGIPATDLSKIFDMFSQVDRSVERSTGGLGIGLALVKGLVEMHGGTVTAESDGAGMGSLFTVRLPVACAVREPTPAAPPRELGQNAGVGRRILVVDDNADAARSMARVLKLLGNEARTALDGLEALRVADEFRPEIILMDLGMPSLNGYEATRRIRGLPWGPSVTIIALTGWGQDRDRLQSRDAGCDGHLVKPVSFTDLEKLLSDPPPRETDHSRRL